MRLGILSNKDGFIHIIAKLLSYVLTVMKLGKFAFGPFPTFQQFTNEMPNSMFTHHLSSIEDHVLFVLQTYTKAQTIAHSWHIWQC